VTPSSADSLPRRGALSLPLDTNKLGAPDRMDPAAVTPDSFNFVTLFLRADWVVKLVMTGLALASLWSWTIILDKTFRFGALNREADRFEDAVASGRSLEEVATEAGERPRHALPRMLQAALREWRESRAKGLAGEGHTAFL